MDSARGGGGPQLVELLMVRQPKTRQACRADVNTRGVSRVVSAPWVPCGGAVGAENKVSGIRKVTVTPRERVTRHF